MAPDRSARASADERMAARSGASRAMFDEAASWLDKYRRGLQTIFSSSLVRGFVFEPFKGLLDFGGDLTEVEVRRTITIIALMNAAMAAVPGSIGYGLFVALALEAYMAYKIARLLGFSVSSPAELIKTVGAASMTVVSAGLLFKEIFAFLWRALALFPVLGGAATFLAEYATTVVIGSVLWVAFDAIKTAGGRLDDGDALSRALREQVSRGWNIGSGMLKQQWSLLRGVLRPQTFRIVAERVKAFLTGDVVVDEARLRGDLFVFVGMNWLMARQAERLDGPLGELFLGAVRRGVPDLSDATPDEMGDYMRQLSGERLDGMMNLIKGEVFEAMVERSINLGSTGESARLHDDRSAPGSDMVLVSPDGTSEVLVSLKATDDPSYIARALARYPEVPVMTTDEVASQFAGDDMVMASGIRHAEVMAVTEENFEEMLWQLPSVAEVTGGGLTLSAFASLYPFAVAWRRGKITREQFLTALQRVTGTTSKALVSRLALSVALGPVFGWFLLARGAGFVAKNVIAVAAEPGVHAERTTYLLRAGPAET